MFKRYLQNKLPESSFFLFGPRQVGKSTLLHSEKPHLTIDLLDPELQLSYNKSPNLLRQQLDDLAPGENQKILIAEIQRVPKLLDIVHAVMEQRPELLFILCGSSARKLRRGASNLLGGRALYRAMHPLTLNELADDFNLQWVLAYGSLPKIYSTLKQKKITEAQDLLRAYGINYLREEIKAEALVRNLQGSKISWTSLCPNTANRLIFLPSPAIARWLCQRLGNIIPSLRTRSSGFSFTPI
jgi:predicted AAA+ superfamily ATPase